MTELLTAMTLLLITLTIIFAIFGGARKIFETVEDEYIMGSEATGAIRWLRHDLAYTTLSSIRVFPNRTVGAGEPPGLSLISADKVGDFGEFEFSEHGTPKWSKYVYYTLAPDPQHPETSSLLRWEGPIAGAQHAPVPSDSMPARWVQSNLPRTVLRNLLSKGYKVGTGSSSTVELQQDSTQPGGFQVQFVRYGASGGKGTLVDQNPTDPGGDRSSPDTTSELVEVTLHFAEQSPRTGNWSTMRVNFRVFPQN